MYTLLHPISSAGSPVQLTVTSLPWRDDLNVGDSYPVFEGDIGNYRAGPPKMILCVYSWSGHWRIYKGPIDAPL